MSMLAAEVSKSEEFWYIKRGNKIKTALTENFLLFSFAIALLIAMSYPYAGILFNSWRVGEFSIVGIVNYAFVFFISGFTLKMEELRAVMKHKVPIIYSLIAINFVTTLLGFGLIKLPGLIKNFRIGETIFATVPTTLGVCVTIFLMNCN